MWRVEIPEVSKTCRLLKEQSEWVYNSQLIGTRVEGTTIDNFVIIDCRHVLILDSVERYQILMNQESTNFFICENWHGLTFKESKKIENKPIGKGSQKKPRTNRKMRMEEHHDTRAVIFSRATHSQMNLVNVTGFWSLIISYLVDALTKNDQNVMLVHVMFGYRIKKVKSPSDPPYGMNLSKFICVLKASDSWS